MKLRRRPRFGVEYYYPECKLSQILCDFAKRRMFKNADIQKFKDAGINISIIDS